MPENDGFDLTGLDEKRLFASLSYLFILVLVPLFFTQKDPFVQFHARQGLMLFLGLIIAGIAAYWLPALGNILFVLLLIVDVIALLQALLGRWWKIPLIGDLAQKFRI